MLGEYMYCLLLLFLHSFSHSHTHTNAHSFKALVTSALILAGIHSYQSGCQYLRRTVIEPKQLRQAEKESVRQIFIKPVKF